MRKDNRNILVREVMKTLGNAAKVTHAVGKDLSPLFSAKRTLSYASFDDDAILRELIPMLQNKIDVYKLRYNISGTTLKLILARVINTLAGRLGNKPKVQHIALPSKLAPIANDLLNLIYRELVEIFGREQLKKGLGTTQARRVVYLLMARIGNTYNI